MLTIEWQVWRWRVIILLRILRLVVELGAGLSTVCSTDNPAGRGLTHALVFLLEFAHGGGSTLSTIASLSHYFLIIVVAERGSWWNFAERLLVEVTWPTIIALFEETLLLKVAVRS